MTIMGDASGAGNQGTGQGSGNADGSGNQNAGGSGGSNGQGTSGASGSGTGSGGTDGGTSTWRDSLPPDLKGHATLTKFSSMENLAKSYVNLEQQLGKRGHILPTDKSSPEDWDATFDALGRPPLDKYEVKAAKEANAESLGRFKQAAHKTGLLPKQAQEMYDWAQTEAKSAREAQIQAAKADGEQKIGALKQEWGKEYDSNVRLAVRAAEHASPELRQYLEKTGLGNDTTLIRALAKLGKLLGEDSLRQSGSSGGGGALDNGQIEAEIAQIRNNPEFVSYQDSPKKRQLNARLTELYQMKHSA